jgi:hypothetical protein
MTKRHDIPWPRISIEATAIVGSILLAFAIDAWWESSRDIERESTLLAALNHDFEQNHALLKETLASNQKSLATVQEFSKVIAGSETIPRNFDLLYALSFRVQFFEPVTATYDALISGGDFALIRSDESREAMVEWRRSVASNNRAEGYLTEQFMDEVYAFATKTGSLSRLLADQKKQLPDANSASAPVTPAYGHDREQLMNNREFHNLLATRALFLQYLVSSNQELLAIAERILNSLPGSRKLAPGE